MCWSLSLSLSPVFVLKKREAWAIEKKYGHMKVHEKKERKKEIAMLSKEFI